MGALHVHAKQFIAKTYSAGLGVLQQPLHFFYYFFGGTGAGHTAVVVHAKNAVKGASALGLYVVFLPGRQQVPGGQGQGVLVEYAGPRGVEYYLPACAAVHQAFYIF